MRVILKRPWLGTIIWAILTVIFVVTMPDINKIVRLKGEPKISQEYPSQVAAALEKEYQGVPKDKKLSTVAIVFYDKNGLSNKDIEAIKKIIYGLDNSKERYNIENISTHFKNPELKNYYVSSNNKVVLASIQADKSRREIIEIRNDIYKFIESVQNQRI